MSGAFSQLTLSWVKPAQLAALKRPLIIDDVPPLRPAASGVAIVDAHLQALQASWHRELQKRSPSFTRALARVFGPPLVWLGLLQIVQVVILVCFP